MNKAAPIILLLVSIALGAFAIYEYQQAEHFSDLVAQLRKDAAGAREESDTNTAEIRKLKEQTRTQKVAIDQLEARNKELVNGASPDAAKSASASTPGEAAKGDGGGFMKGFAKMFSDPKMKGAMRAQQTAAVNMMYADLAKELGLAPDVARQVLALIGDRQADVAEKGMAAMSNGEKDMAKIGKETTAMKSAYDDQLKAILGEDGYKKFQQYEKTIGERAVLDQIQRQLSAAGTAIDPAQTKGLLAIMTEERVKTPNPLGSGGEPGAQMKLMQSEQAIDGWIKSQEDFNRRVLDRARTVLNPDQMLSFEAAQKQQLDMQKMGVQMSKEMFKGGGK
ncbi:MAG: hypothetical protein WCF18_19030 [Chthoniobacteraceae bacterium]